MLIKFSLYFRYVFFNFEDKDTPANSKNEVDW